MDVKKLMDRNSERMNALYAGKWNCSFYGSCKNYRIFAKAGKCTAVKAKNKMPGNLIFKSIPFASFILIFEKPVIKAQQSF